MNNDKRVNVNISNKTIVRVILWVIAALLLFRFFGRISHVLYLIFSSFFLAMALNPVVKWTSRRLHIKNRIGATSAAYLMVVLVIGLFCFFVIPPLVSQTRDFINKAPSSISSFQKQNNSISRAAKRYHLDKKLSTAASDFATKHGNFGSTVLNTGKRIVEIIASILAVVVMTFMMLVEGPYWLKTYFELLPPKRRDHQQRLAHKMYKGVSGFVNGQVIIALVAGLASFIALEIASHVIGVSVNAGALAGMVAVMGIIPLFGNPLAATIVVLVSVLSSLALAVVMLIFFVIYFFVENHTLQPVVQSRLNNLTALGVFIAAIIGVGFAGFLGAIVAIPGASAIKVLVEDQIDRRGLRQPKLS